MNTIQWPEFKQMYDDLITVLWDFEGVLLNMDASERWEYRDRNWKQIAEIEEFIKPMRDNLNWLDNWQ